MYSSFINMWNWDYIQQQQALQHHQNQVYQIADCAKKLKDFLESAEKIDPSYSQPFRISQRTVSLATEKEGLK